MPRTPLFAAVLLATAYQPAHATVRNFFNPGFDGARLDSCLSSASDCGKPAADAFCRREGFSEALIFQREPASLTRRLGNGQACTGPSCTGFRQIKCYSGISRAGPANSLPICTKSQNPLGTNACRYHPAEMTSLKSVKSV
ncbi:MAG: hypothetical protein HY245_04700 [Rhizobiales bacterium]|nr:hypothetical protein [Hyphomicrobiales bacterium]MBI3672713.1 hypothetical protein [Hyphomicrobiales bacterium]